MKTLIYLEDALNIAMQYCPDDDGSCSKSGVDIREMLDELESLPAAQPEEIIPRKGYKKFTRYWCECGNYLGIKGDAKYCSECGKRVKWDCEFYFTHIAEDSQNVPDGDLISRKAAIDRFIVASNQDGAYGYLDTKSAVGILNDLPSVQPE